MSDTQIPGTPIGTSEVGHEQEPLVYLAPDSISYEQMADCISGRAGKRAEAAALAAGEAIARLSNTNVQRAEPYKNGAVESGTAGVHAAALKRNGHIAGTS